MSEAQSVPEEVIAAATEVQPVGEATDSNESAFTMLDAVEQMGLTEGEETAESQFESAKERAEALETEEAEQVEVLKGIDPEGARLLGNVIKHRDDFAGDRASARQGKKYVKLIPGQEAKFTNPEQHKKYYGALTEWMAYQSGVVRVDMEQKAKEADTAESEMDEAAFEEAYKERVKEMSIKTAAEELHKIDTLEDAKMNEGEYAPMPIQLRTFVNKGVRRLIAGVTIAGGVLANWAAQRYGIPGKEAVLATAMTFNAAYAGMMSMANNAKRTVDFAIKRDSAEAIEKDIVSDYEPESLEAAADSPALARDLVKEGMRQRGDTLVEQRNAAYAEWYTSENLRKAALAGVKAATTIYAGASMGNAELLGDIGDFVEKGANHLLPPHTQQVGALVMQAVGLGYFSRATWGENGADQKRKTEREEPEFESGLKRKSTTGRVQ